MEIGVATGPVSTWTANIMADTTSAPSRTAVLCFSTDAPFSCPEAPSFCPGADRCLQNSIATSRRCASAQGRLNRRVVFLAAASERRGARCRRFRLIAPGYAESDLSWTADRATGIIFRDGEKRRSERDSLSPGASEHRALPGAVDDRSWRASGPNWTPSTRSPTAPGFVWRLQTEDGNAMAIRPFRRAHGDQHVGWDRQGAPAVVYSEPRRAAARSQAVVRAYGGPILALWWIPAGHIPTVEEAKQRLEWLKERAERVQTPLRSGHRFLRRTRSRAMSLAWTRDSASGRRKIQQ